MGSAGGVTTVSTVEVAVYSAELLMTDNLPSWKDTRPTATRQTRKKALTNPTTPHLPRAHFLS